MAIDKSQEYWHGNCAEDTVEYLNEYSENKVDKTVLIKCIQCGEITFTFKIDVYEGAIEVICTDCKKKRLLLDSEEYWEDCDPEKAKCLECKNNQFNLVVGFVYRKSEDIKGSVKWVYVGNRCAKCGLLGSYGDWEITYAPTDEMEQNV